MLERKSDEIGIIEYSFSHMVFLFDLFLSALLYGSFHFALVILC